MNKVWFFWIFFPGVLLVHAQENCSEKILSANKAFQSGKFETVITLLAPCENSGLHKDEKPAVYRMLSLSHFLLNHVEQADTYAQKLLNVQPEYRSFPLNDPGGFSKFLNNYEVNVRWELGIRAGIAISNPVILNSYAVTAQKETYKSSIQYSAGIQLQRRLNSFLSARLSPGISLLKYQRQINDVLGVQQNYTEEQTYIDLPLHLLATKQFKETRLYAGIGIQTGLLLSAYGLHTSQLINDENRIVNAYDASDDRTSVLYAADLGCGADIPVGKGRLGISAFWSNNLRNSVIPEQRFSQTAQMLSDRYVENDFKINALRIQTYFQIPIKHQIEKK